MSSYRSANIVVGPDGKYRWAFEFNMYRNPTILLTIWKIFAGIFAGIWIFLLALEASDGDLDAKNGFILTGVFVLALLGMLVLSTAAYLVYALYMGGGYCVLFEMDDEGIIHRQLERQVKKAQAVSALNVLVGLATANPSQMGIGMLSARSELSSTFSKVRSVRANRRRGVIKVNEPLAKNQVYCEPEDFDFVLGHIVGRCRQAKVTGR